MEPRRGDLAVAGSVILDTILRELDAEDITLCDLALREGLVLDYIHQHRTEIARADRYPDVRRRSVVELGERCNYFAQHAAQVSRLAVSMFDQTRGVHGLKDKEREWLEYAALLHDVGVHISYDKHHRHSYYLIKHGDLRGFDPQEIEVIGLIARYHRRASPKKGHPGYGELPSDLRKAVKVLSSIVRLAEGLDRSHVQVLDSISLANRGDDYLMQLRTNGDAELELWAAGRHVEPFEDMLGKPVRFEVAPAPARAKRAPVRASAPAKAASAAAVRRSPRGSALRADVRSERALIQSGLKVFENRSADELAKDRVVGHGISRHRAEPLQEREQPVRLAVDGAVGPHLQQQRLRERPQHGQLVRQRRVEDRVAVLGEREDVQPLPALHRVPAPQRLGRRVPASGGIPHDPPQQPRVGDRHAVVAIEVELRDRRHVDPVHGAGRHVRDELRVQPVDAFEQDDVARFQCHAGGPRCGCP